ncbi:MAG: threo-3-hydroxy-L-aspartate ammonia-lyase [Steroidobacteraceae bacterium]
MVPPTPPAHPESDTSLPARDDVLAAALRLRGAAHRTPVLTSRRIDASLGAQLFFKCENLQRTGAFKFRGAYNALLQLSAAQQRTGVATYSSGNHSQAIALAAQLLGMTATIVMPLDAPSIKVIATAGYGARVVHYDRFTEDRVAICEALAARHGLAIIPPFDHAHVIAGQGTAALELFEEVGQLDALFVPLGGGGLLSGSLLAAEAMPGCRVYGVEPEAGNDAQQSMRRGEIVQIATPATIADGAQTQALGQLTFPIIRRAVADIVTVSDAALIAGMRQLAEAMKLVVEPTGVLGFAGAAAFGDQLRGLRIGVILSGGNVDLARFAALVGEGAG